MFTEQLPVAGTSGPAVTVRYTPISRGVGTLVISQKRCTCEYRIHEITNDFGGRAVRMVKPVASPGSDRDSGYYDVFVGRDGEMHCDCKGFTAHGQCKHTAALDAIVGNGWINQSASVAEPVCEDDTEIDEPIPGFAAFAEAIPVEPVYKDRVWCNNDRECGGIDVPGYEVEGVHTRHLCVACYKAAMEAHELPGYAEYLAEQDAKDEADPVMQAKRQAWDDERSAEYERRLREIDEVRAKLAKLHQDNFNRPVADEVAVDRLISKLSELEADLPVVVPAKRPAQRPGSFLDLSPAKTI